jgi:hypothetical protein
MASVPLDGFPPDFLPLCPKCESRSLHFQQVRHSFAWGSTETRVSCYTCGLVKYGDPAVRQAFESQLGRWRQRQQEAALQAALEQERVFANQREREQEEAARLAREQAELAETRAQEEARAQRQAAIKALREARLTQPPAPPTPLAPVPAPKKCAWHECSNPAQLKSIYCSRTCNNRNAHARCKARRAATPPTPLAPARGGMGVNAELRKEVLARKARYETRTTIESV